MKEHCTSFFGFKPFPPLLPHYWYTGGILVNVKQAAVLGKKE